MSENQYINNIYRLYSINSCSLRWREILNPDDSRLFLFGPIQGCYVSLIHELICSFIFDHTANASKN